ncbi:DUF3558 family protein [Amycolatopsis magusensis]|uniref:DUF3558 family protein n=1 Tax=Amycolatopsis magusensis TaxID=882444 RepID=UPI00379A7E7F
MVSALAFLAGCTSGQGGQAQPVSTPQDAPASSEITASPQGLHGLKACAVLDKALQGRDFPPGEADNVGSANGCSASKFGSATSLNLDDRQGIDDLDADPAKAHDGKINGRPIRQVREIDGDEATCLVLLEVTAKVRAMVSVTLGTQGSTEQACSDAFSIAQAVEPQLPAR